MRRIYREEHEMFRAAVRGFFEREAVPYHDQWEEDGITPLEIWRKAGAQGILAPQVPEEYGGPGADYKFLAIVTEESAALGISGMNMVVHSDIVGGYILAYGTEEQKKHWLPQFVSGDCIGAIAMTEPNAGSDLQAIKTTAVRDGDDYILNGSKTFVSNGRNAGVVIIVAKTDPEMGAKGLTLFLVPAGTEGFTKGPNLKKMGLKAQDTSELFLDGVRVPASNMLGAENQGFFHLMGELPQERLGCAIAAVATSQRAFDLTVDYTRERKAFGKTVLDFQNTRFTLAQIKTELSAAWAFLDQCIEEHYVGELTAEKAAMIKLYTSEMQCSIVDRCLQFFGGYGYMTEYPISRIYTDSRIQRIYGGTSEIMKEIIGRTL